jgi:hypothetical protein
VGVNVAGLPTPAAGQTLADLVLTRRCKSLWNWNKNSPFKESYFKPDFVQYGYQRFPNQCTSSWIRVIVVT